MFNHYLNDIRNCSPLEKEEERELIIKAKAGNTLAYNKVIKSNLRFVIDTAKKYQGQGIDLEDLVAEGNIGLIKAFDRFDISKGFRFITYAVWWIRQSILTALHEHAKLIRLPLNKISSVTKINKIQETLRDALRREPTQRELEDELGENKKLLNDLQFNYTILDLDNPYTEDGKDLNNVISIAEELNPEDYEKEFRKELEDILTKFTEREKIIIKMYYGIGYKDNYTLQEIGEEFGITRERVRQIKEKVLQNLRKKHKSDKLRIFL